jgi:hypothetical protein
MSVARDNARHPGTGRPSAMACRISMSSGPGRGANIRSTSTGTQCPKASRYAAAATEIWLASMGATVSV